MRVLDVNEGTLEDGGITLDLIQDAYYVYRRQAPQPGGMGPIIVRPDVFHG